MFKFTQARAVDRAVWDDGDDEQIQVQYNDGGLHQQLAARLQSTKCARTCPTTAAGQRPAFVPQTWQQPASPPSQSPGAADVAGLIGDIRHLQAAFQEVSEPPEQQTHAEPEAIGAHHVQQVVPQQGHFATNTAAVLDNNRQLLAGILQERQQPPLQPQVQQQHAVPAPAAFANPWSQHPLQEQHQQQTQQHHESQQTQAPAQPHLKAPASYSQLLAQPPHKQHAPAKPQQHKVQQQRRKSVLYSTPQQQAPKKKPRFSIRDTPAPAPTSMHRTPVTATRPAAPAAAEAATQAMPGSQVAGLTGPSALAALLGSSAAATPARRKPAATTAGLGRTGESSGLPAAADFSKTPGSSSRKGVVGPSGLFPTPRYSTNKGSKLGQAVHREEPSPVPSFGVAGAAAAAVDKGARTPQGTAAAAAGIADDGDMTAVPAALFQDDDAASQGDRQQQQQQPAQQDAAAAALTPQISRDGTARGRRSSIATNPVQLMEEQRQRQMQFLSALPAASASKAAAFNSNSSMLHCLGQSGGRGVNVPVGSSLSKVMQQIVGAQKEQQELLEQQLAESGAAQPAPAGVLELEVVNRHLEAHMVKCLCTVTRWQLPQQQQQQAPVNPATQQQRQQQQQQQPQHKLGEQVFLFIASKTALNLDLETGRRVHVHAPWYEVTSARAGEPAVLMVYLISSVH